MSDWLWSKRDRDDDVCVSERLTNLTYMLKIGTKKEDGGCLKDQTMESGEKRGDFKCLEDQLMTRQRLKPAERCMMNIDWKVMME